jgi:hypothetical protein
MMAVSARCASLRPAKARSSVSGRPEGARRIERVLKTIQQQFLVEVTEDEPHPARHQVKHLEALNDLPVR